MKKFLCMLLVLMLLFALCACEEKEEEIEETKETTEETTGPSEEELLRQQMIGKWSTKVDMTDYANDEFGDAFGVEETVEEFSFIMYFTFNEDGTGTFAMDLDHLATMSEKLADELWAAAVDMIAEEMECTPEEAEKMMAEADVTKEAFAKELDLADAFEDEYDDGIIQEMNWFIEGDRVFWYEENPDFGNYLRIEIVDDRFVIDSAIGLDNDLSDYIEEMVFERVTE